MCHYAASPSALSRNLTVVSLARSALRRRAFTLVNGHGTALRLGTNGPTKLFFLSRKEKDLLE